MKESKGMMRREVAFMKKKGAPASMIKHEEREMKGVKKMAGGGTGASKAQNFLRQQAMPAGRGMQGIGSQRASNSPFQYTPNASRAGQASNTKDYVKQGMASGLKPGTPAFSKYISDMPNLSQSSTDEQKADAGMKKGGMAGSYRRAADGVASKGKTKGHVVKMREGGSVGGSYRRAADGIASKGKTKGKMVKMNKGGYC